MPERIPAGLTIVSDPARDGRWASLVRRHVRASVFHSPEWLLALQETYGFEMFAVTTSTGPVLENGLVVCRVRGWRGDRLVSQPFSDHCDPLFDDPQRLSSVVSALHQDNPGEIIEIRPRHGAWGAWAEDTDSSETLIPAERFAHHTVDLRPSSEVLFKRLHPSSTQRAVRRAVREGLEYGSGRAESHVGEFFRLLRMTRRRHRLPPQPIAWFRALVRQMGDSLTIHVARKDGQAVAALMTLRFRDVLVYKYGGSDASYHRLGAVPFLFWRVMQGARADGATSLDLGRSDLDQPGLIRFKEHLGASAVPLTYYASAATPLRSRRRSAVERATRRVVAVLPDAAVDCVGRLAYRYIR